MTIKLSICIPTYNRADCIGTAIDSVLAQVTEEVDIAICDNGSVDDTEKIIQGYLKKFPRITYF